MQHVIFIKNKVTKIHSYTHNTRTPSLGHFPYRGAIFQRFWTYFRVWKLAV